MSFPENLRTLRVTRGLTQPALAEKAGIEQSYLSKLENGRSKPSEDMLTRLAQALEVKLEALQNGDETEERARRRQWVLQAAGATLVLVMVFLLGRVTAVYPLSIGQVIKGKSAGADENLVLSIRDLAPKSIEVVSVSDRGGNGHIINVSGSTPDYATLDAYMGVIKSKFGGSFSYIELDPTDSNNAVRLHQFHLEYAAPVAR